MTHLTPEEEKWCEERANILYLSGSVKMALRLAMLKGKLANESEFCKNHGYDSTAKREELSAAIAELEKS